MSLLPSRDPAAPDAEPRVIGVDSEDADDVLAALSAGTARKLLAELNETPAPPGELADRVDTSLQNAQYHLQKLENRRRRRSRRHGLLGEGPGDGRLRAREPATGHLCRRRTGDLRRPERADEPAGRRGRARGRQFARPAAVRPGHRDVLRAVGRARERRRDDAGPELPHQRDVPERRLPRRRRTSRRRRPPARPGRPSQPSRRFSRPDSPSSRAAPSCWRSSSRSGTSIGETAT